MRLGPSSLVGLALALPAAAQEISLRLPVACEIGRTCFIQHYVDRDPSPAASDYQCGTLTYDTHDGTDIRVPTMAAQKAGIDVVAAADGKVASTREGVADVAVTPQTREAISRIGCGNAVVIDHGNGWRTAYCHMAKGSVTVRSGQEVKAGDRIGRIGLSGLTEFPHLHFTLIKDGKPVDPFAYGAPEKSCGGGTSLWEASLQRALAYQGGSVLNKGFAPGPVTMEAIESGAADQDTPTTRSPALVAYVRAIGLKGGDVQTLTLFDPDGKPLAQNKAPPLDRDKAQWMAFSGVKQPPGGFRPGLYRAVYRVERDGKPAIEQAFGISLRP
ncbi:M23 family metallopeptidase [Microvirga sp. HBU67558]|uniref:M23 family metallopeptidase n=1 Tax=Microvirga TaxID=186650 RepID=UPI001B36A691|nr:MULTISPECIES: M23 family metallopeptidase [unclassified Microvirga]MBQ0822503.1 M23 family metallopeptidase [Microvirga sp. HBU67558]